MPDPELKVGDVAHDLVKRGKVQVVAKAADSVTDHRAQEGFDLAEYKSHPLLDVAEDEPVYTCVYLPEEPTVSFSGTYDFPRSRLARIPVEEANEDLDRFQRELVVDLLADVFERALTADSADAGRPDSFKQAIRFCWPDEHNDLQRAAFELADAAHREEVPDAE